MIEYSLQTAKIKNREKQKGEKIVNKGTPRKNPFYSKANHFATSRFFPIVEVSGQATRVGKLGLKHSPVIPTCVHRHFAFRGLLFSLFAAP